MWNRSGQALTLPLQILSDPGADLYLTLDPGGGPVLAAYIRGGTPFRLLVPPGRYRVGIAAGRDWQDEARLFGAATRHIGALDAPTFGTEGVGRRSGHLIDLRNGAVSVRDFGLCRAGATVARMRPPASTPESGPAMPPVPPTLAEPRRVETRLPPPDQPPVSGPDPDHPAFARPFAKPARIPIPRVTAPDHAAPTTVPPRSKARAQANRWTVCD